MTDEKKFNEVLKALINTIIENTIDSGMDNDEQYKAVKSGIEKYLILNDKEYNAVIGYVVKKLKR